MNLKKWNMECDVKYFGMIGEKLKLSSERIVISQTLVHTKDLQKSFTERFPELKEMTFKIAVNGIITNELPDTAIHVIALLPPFAGG